MQTVLSGSVMIECDSYRQHVCLSVHLSVTC